MDDKNYFSTADFARFARVTRHTLLFYDKIGLLQPVSRGANKYRQYSSGQLSQVNVIRTLQQLGMTLTEIKALKDQRTPALTEEVLSHQIGRIDQKIQEWVQARKLLHVLIEMIQSVEAIDESQISIQHLPSMPITLGKWNEYVGGRTDFDALLDFYLDIGERYPDLDMNYPTWGMFSEERIKQMDWHWPDRYYFHNPDGLDSRPAAMYAVGYTRGAYGSGDKLYKRMLEYIAAEGYEVAGAAYEEYPLNEISIQNMDDYLMRVLITVRLTSEKAKHSNPTHNG